MSTHIILNATANSENSHIDRWILLGFAQIGVLKIGPELSEFWNPIISTLILSLSDQMLLTGLAMMITALTLHCTISVYHASIVLDLAWFAAGAHLLTLGFLNRKIQERNHLRKSRLFLMLSMGLLLLINTFFAGHWAMYMSGPFNAQCIWNNVNQHRNVFGGEPLPIMLVNLLLIVVLYTTAIVRFSEPSLSLLRAWFVTAPEVYLEMLYEHFDDKSMFNRYAASQARLVRILARIHSNTMIAVEDVFGSVSVAFATNLFWFAWGVKNIFKDRNAPYREANRFSGSPMEGEESRLGFGQIIPILLLGSTVLVAIEAYEGMGRSCSQ